MLYSDSAKAQTAPQKSVTKAGAFSLMPIYGLESFQAINENGESSEFSSNTLGLRISLKPFSQSLPGLLLFAETFMSEGENSADSLEKIESDTFRFGFTSYLAKFLYVGGFYGSKEIEVSSDSNPQVLSWDATIAGIGLGLDVLTIGESFNLSIEAWKYAGFAPRKPEQDYNLGTDSADFLIGIRWSPAVTVNW